MRKGFLLSGILVAASWSIGAFADGQLYCEAGPHGKNGQSITMDHQTLPDGSTQDSYQGVTLHTQKAGGQILFTVNNATTGSSSDYLAERGNGEFSFTALHLADPNLWLTCEWQ